MLLSPLLLLLLAAPGLPQESDGVPPADEPEELPLIAGPEIVAYVDAPYPPEAQELGLEGTVLLLIEIDEEGAVAHAEVLEGAGHGFDEAALEAVRAMRFSPARTVEGPVPVMIEFAYGFQLTPEEPEEAVPPPVTLEGRIREMGTRKPVEGAQVVVRGTELVGRTDAEGRFEVAGVPPGQWPVWVVKPGYVRGEKDLEVVEGEVTTAELWLRSESYRDNEAVATYRREREEVTRRTLTIEEVRRVPGTFGDPVKVVQTLPGAARTPFGTGLLVIRGTNPEDSGTYIDGVRIPIIYHLTGTTSVIAPELIESVDYLPGGYGVQYGRSLGGVVDVRTRREFEDSKLIWSTDILDSGLYYEGRVGKGKKHGLAVGARRSYVDAFLPLFVRSDFSFRPRYWDYQVKWAPESTGPGELSLFVYGYDDVIKVASPEDVAQGPDQDTQGDLSARYLAHRAILIYRRPLSDALSLVLTPSIGVDGGGGSLGEEFDLSTLNLLVELRAELPWQPTEAVQVVPGVDFIGAAWTFDFASAIQYTDFDDPFAERQPISFDGRGTAWTTDVYLKANLRPLADRDRLLLTPGIRANTIAFTYSGGITSDEEIPPWARLSFDPRFHGRFEMVDGLSLKGSTGLYHQMPQPGESIGLGTDIDLDYERAWSNSFGLEHQISPNLRWDVDFFYKEMEKLVVFDFDWEGYGTNPFINAGSGRAYGMEIIARHDRADRFFGWVSYTLSRSIRKDRPTQDWYPFDFDQTHIFSLQAGYDLPWDLGLSAQVQYVTGNPDTPYNAGVYDADGGFYNPFRIGEWNSERLPPFFQTSLRLDKLWTFRTWQLNTYVDLLNAVRGVNPEFTIYNYDYSDYAYVRGLPFIPNVGVEARFAL